MAGGGIGSGLGAPTGFAQPMTGRDYNQRLMQGETNEQIRASQAGLFGKGPSDAQWNQIVTQAGLESGRPLPGSAQFYQPAYQTQYQNYNMGNPMSVSQYGQGFGGYNPYIMQMQTPFNPYTGGYDYGMQTPFSMGPAYGMQSPFSMAPNYGPSQPILSRSAGMRGTPNVMMRRAEGGIASLMDDE